QRNAPRRDVRKQHARCHERRQAERRDPAKRVAARPGRVARSRYSLGSPNKFGQRGASLSLAIYRFFAWSIWQCGEFTSDKQLADLNSRIADLSSGIEGITSWDTGRLVTSSRLTVTLRIEP